MPCYYFCLRPSNNAKAGKGSAHELPDIRAALAEAQGTARAMLHRRVKRAPIELHGSLDIEDERGETVARIPLADVVQQIS